MTQECKSPNCRAARRPSEPHRHPACAPRTCCRSAAALDRSASGRWKCGAVPPSTPACASSRKTRGSACASCAAHCPIQPHPDAAARSESGRLPPLLRRAWCAPSCRNRPTTASTSFASSMRINDLRNHACGDRGGQRSRQACRGHDQSYTVSPVHSTSNYFVAMARVWRRWAATLDRHQGHGRPA
jgi:hypothetical protein